MAQLGYKYRPTGGRCRSIARKSQVSYSTTKCNDHRRVKRQKGHKERLFHVTKKRASQIFLKIAMDAGLLRYQTNLPALAGTGTDASQDNRYNQYLYQLILACTVIMSSLIANAGTVIEQRDVQDAPLGSLIFQTANANGRVYSPYKPISIMRKYRIRGWIRRTSQNDAQTYYIGALIATYNKTVITNAGWCYYYFINGNNGNQLAINVWRYFEFEVGAGTTKPFPNNAKFLAMASVVNYQTSTATYQFCGFQVIQIY